MQILRLFDQLLRRERRALLAVLAAVVFVLLLAGLWGGVRPAFATDTGLLAPSASAAGSPTCDTAGNGLLSDNSYVACEDGESFVLSGFGANVPVGSTILGIRVEIEHRTSNDFGTDQTCVTLSWDGGSTFPSNQNCANTNADGAEADDYDTVGTVTDDWGHVWTPAEINGLYLKAEANSGASTMSIDGIRVAVEFTPGKSGFLPPSASSAGSPTCDTTGNALLSDDSYVACEDGENFVLSGFGLNIPAGSTIDGIKVEIEHRTSNDFGTDQTCITLSWDGGSTFPSNQNCANTNADGAEADEVDVGGAATDDWGHAWTVAEINGLYLKAEANSGVSTMSIDRIRVWVAYTPPSGTPTDTPNATDTPVSAPTDTPVGTPTDTPVPSATPTNTPTPFDSGFVPASASAAGSPTCDTVGNALLSDDSYVLCEDSENFVLSGFGLNLPAGAAIDGIQVEIEHRTSLDWFLDETCITLSWDGGASYPTNQNCANTNADGAEADEVDVVGAVTDDWGHVWTAAEINDLYLRAAADSGPSTMSIDRIRVSVAYTLPTPTATATATNTPVPAALPVLELPPAPTDTTATPDTAVFTPVQVFSATPEPLEVATATPTATARQPTPSSLVGDVGCDGQVDGVDALLILQLDAALVDSLLCEGNGDVTGDGIVNSIDASLLLQYDAGLLDTLSLP